MNCFQFDTQMQESHRWTILIVVIENTSCCKNSLSYRHNFIVFFPISYKKAIFKA